MAPSSLSAWVAGYDFTARGFTFGPYARLNYLQANIDGFQEHIDDMNAGFGLGLAMQEQDVESLTWVLGGQGSYAFSTGFGVLVPQVRFEWEHEFLNNQRKITGAFVSDPAQFFLFFWIRTTRIAIISTWAWDCRPSFSEACQPLFITKPCSP